MVQRRASPQPLELVTRHSMLHRDLECLSGTLGDFDGDNRVSVALEKSGESVGLDDVA